MRVCGIQIHYRKPVPSMKTPPLLLVLPVLLFARCTPADQDVALGKVDGLYSEILKEQRTIYVYVPQTGNAGEGPPPRYPVVYLLDGDVNFNAAAATTQLLGERNGNPACPPMIVVGIANTDRTRDLTPSRSATEPFPTATSGGGERFTDFLRKELIPYVESKYPTAPYRTLVGHSLGGLLVVNTLLNHAQLFNAYVAIDPSLSYDGGRLIGEASVRLREWKYAGRKCYLAVANTLPPGMDTAAVRRDTTRLTAHVRAILRFADSLKSNPGNRLQWRCRYYPDEDHGPVVLPATYDALRFVFGYYQLPPAAGFLSPAFRADSALAAHFRRASAELGYPVLPPEEMVNGLGFAYLQVDLPEKARAVFALNLATYPRSPRAHEGMGDCYRALNETEKAAEFYGKALALKDSPGTRQKLERLRAGK
jgi:predicted alpha/beta superfamily hydrolase